MRRPASLAVVIGTRSASAPCDRPEREARRFGPAIMIVLRPARRWRNRHSLRPPARVRPGRALVDREARRAVAGDCGPAASSSALRARVEVGAETGPASSVNTRVVIPAVAGDFVPGIDDAADQRRVALRHPAEREEGRLDARSRRTGRAPRRYCARRGSSASQSALSITCSKAPTWNQSSISTDSAWSHRGGSARPRGRAPAEIRLLPALHPIDQQGQHAAQRGILILDPCPRCAARRADLDREIAVTDARRCRQGPLAKPASASLDTPRAQSAELRPSCGDRSPMPATAHPARSRGRVGAVIDALVIAFGIGDHRFDRAPVDRRQAARSHRTASRGPASWLSRRGTPSDAAVQRLERVGGEMRVAAPAAQQQAVLMYGSTSSAPHRIEMVHRDDALAQLLEPPEPCSSLAEFGLAEQEYLQQRVPAGLEVGQHAQFFERRRSAAPAPRRRSAA